MCGFCIGLFGDSRWMLYIVVNIDVFYILSSSHLAFLEVVICYIQT